MQAYEAGSARLKVAIVHSFYGSGTPSGENQAVAAQAAALRKAGHRAFLLAEHTDDLMRSPAYRLRAAATVVTGRGRSPLARLRRLRPDVVHVHNLFPNLGHSWLLRWPGPLVATLHNYRPLCAAATLYRDGATCTRCPDGDRWAGLRHACYRGSRAATAPLAWAGRRGAAANPLLRRADGIVVLSDASRRMYVRAGALDRKLTLVPNFTVDLADAPESTVPAAGSNARWVFAGRLSPEKGLLELLHRWPAERPLDVVGDGPLMEECRRIAPPEVRFLGALPHEELRRRLPTWQGLVFPSRWLEGAPLIYPEALAAGLPVVAFPGSAVAEAVRTQETGMVVSWEEPLGPALAAADERFPTLRSHCRRVFERHYTEQSWVSATEAVYSAAIAARAGATGATP